MIKRERYNTCLSSEINIFFSKESKKKIKHSDGLNNDVDFYFNQKNHVFQIVIVSFLTIKNDTISRLF